MGETRFALCETHPFVPFPVPVPVPVMLINPSPPLIILEMIRIFGTVASSLGPSPTGSSAVWARYG